MFQPKNCWINLDEIHRYLQNIAVTISFFINTRVGTLIVATIYLQLIQNRYMFRSFTVLQCSHQHCVQALVTSTWFLR